MRGHFKEGVLSSCKNVTRQRNIVILGSLLNLPLVYSKEQSVLPKYSTPAKSQLSFHLHTFLYMQSDKMVSKRKRKGRPFTFHASDHCVKTKLSTITGRKIS